MAYVLFLFSCFTCLCKHLPVCPYMACSHGVLAMARHTPGSEQCIHRVEERGLISLASYLVLGHDPLAWF